MNSEPLWRRCRTLANGLRLEMLGLLSKDYPLCVKEVAETLHIMEAAACKHLQLMEVAGFMERKHRGKCLYYSVFEQDALVAGILGHDLSSEQVIFTVTGLTHERRVLILRALGTRGLSIEHLSRNTGISMRAMLRHLDKLERRGFVTVENAQCAMIVPDFELGRRLVESALK